MTRTGEYLRACRAIGRRDSVSARAMASVTGCKYGHMLGDHSIQTVSELLDLSLGVVKVQSMRALARLRVLLGEDEAPPPLPPQPGARYAVPRPPMARSRPVASTQVPDAS
jgi:hypothetical protein